MTTKRDFVAGERAALADAFVERGPDQPTLCEGWQTRDLLQHLVLRDGGPFMICPPRRESKAEAEARLRNAAWSELIQDFRDGPPRGSPFRLPGANTAANFEEFFIHHEDVRRGVPDWTRRELPAGIEDAIWRRLRSPLGRIFARRAGVGLHLHRWDVADGAEPDFARGEHATLRRIRPGVVVSGPPSELLIFLFGRQQSARVELHGPADARDRLLHARLGV